MEIRPRVSGYITKLCVDEGSVVKKGQALFLIDKVQYEAAVRAAEAAVKGAEATKQMQAALDGTLAYADALGIKSLSRTFSFHRPAPWLLEQGIELGGWTNAYSEKYYGLSERIVYVSDSNRREFWNEERMGNAIANGRNLTLLTHPVWWHHSALSSDETFSYLSETVGSRHTALYFAATAKRYADKCPEEIIRC